MTIPVLPYKIKLKMETSAFKLAWEAEIIALERIANFLSKLPEIVKVIFFGSRARGDFNGSSDMDILVIINDISVKEKVIKILHDIELEFDVPLSPVIFTKKEYEMNKKLKSSFIENVEREGIVLYDSEY